MADTFKVEHTRTLNQESVTEEQFAAMQKTFPGMFRRVGGAKADISKFSDEAKKIITEKEADTKDSVKEPVKKSGKSGDNS